MNRRRCKTSRFPQIPGAPSPLTVQAVRPVVFSDVDPMGIVWFGRYTLFVEYGAGELGRQTGLSFENLRKEGLFAPVAQFSIDYLQPMRLGDEIAIRVSMIWTGAAKLNTEYRLSRQDGTVCACAYATQLLMDAATGQPYWTLPPFIEAFNSKWMSGVFACLQRK